MSTTYDRPEPAGEKPRLNPLRQEMRSTLLSVGFKFLFLTGFAPVVRSWRYALIWDAGLDNESRQALQRAMALTYEGFKSAFSKSDLPLPTWLKNEFEAPDE